MKIVSYNIARCTQSKIDHVLGMGANVAVSIASASEKGMLQKSTLTNTLESLNDWD